MYVVSLVHLLANSESGIGCCRHQVDSMTIVNVDNILQSYQEECTIEIRDCEDEDEETRDIRLAEKVEKIVS